MFDYIFSDLILGGVGWICLFLRYRDLEKMEEIKNNKHSGSYSNAGGTFLMNAFIILMIILIFGLIVAGVIGTIKNL